MTEDRDEFLHADAHITRAGTIVGGAGVIVGGYLLATDRTSTMLLIAIPLFLLAGLISTGLHRSQPTPAALTSIARLRDIIPSPVWRATLAVTAIRASAGALTYLLAFEIKRGGDQWIFAAGLLTAGVGALLATFVAPRLHRGLEPDAVLVLALLVPGVVTAIGVVAIGNVGVLAIAFAIGLGNGVSTRSIAVLQTTVPGLARTRTIARSELTFQLATLIGAGLAVQLAPTPRPGLAVAAVVLIVAGLVYARLTMRSLHQQASRLMLADQAPAVHRALPRALLEEAGRLASLGAHRMAIVVADNAVQIARQRHEATLDEPGWERLVPAIAMVKASDDQPDADLVLAVLREAEYVVDHHSPTSRRRRDHR
jgi:hypothetical protein